MWILCRFNSHLRRMKLCIIGAGTAGLCSARRALQNNIEPTIFEQTGDVGGTWVYTDTIGSNEYGLDVHSSMYQGLRTNLPKEIMGFPDFEIAEQYNSYVPAKSLTNFLEEYANHFKLKDYVKFWHYVIRIRPRNNKWQIITRNLITSCVSIYYFDAVMICNGHYHTPLCPSVQGLNFFKGNYSHSHDFKTSAIFKDENVLIIGAGPSGMDLCHEISKVAKRVTLSHHLTDNPKTIFLNNVTQKPDVKELDENGAYFVDGSYETFSTIFFCTGYKYAFPFLSVDCEIHVDDNYVQSLYKHCVNINFPSMSFIGLPYYVCASQMMDLQARFVMEYLTHKKLLPNVKHMLKDTENAMEIRWKQGLKKRQAHMMGPYQEEYYTDLAKTAGIKNISPVMAKLHNESSQHFLDDLINFRNYIFRIVDDETFIQII